MGAYADCLECAGGKYSCVYCDNRTLEARITELEAMLKADLAQHVEIRDSRHATATKVLTGYQDRIALAIAELEDGSRQAEEVIDRALALLKGER